MQSASDSPPADKTAPPAVRVVIPTRDPGPWFDDVVTALAAQDYPAVRVTIVHGEDDGPLLERHRASLPDVEFVSSPAETGFGEKVNMVADRASEKLLLIHHDDLAMEPGTISALVREWLRRNEPRTLVAAKLLDWTEPERLMPAGFNADRFGATSSVVRPGDLDQGQQDRVVDLFGASTACLLVDREYLVSIGGFDEAIDWHGEAFDLALRTRSVGGQVVIPATARARHRGAFDNRDGASTAFRERRHQMRAALAAAPLASLPLLLLSFAVLHLVEFVVAVARLDLLDALSVPAAWLWNLANVGSLVKRRRAITQHESFSGDELRLIRNRGSIRIAESVDRRVSQREIATEAGEATISVIRVAGGIALGAILAFGARHLLTRDIAEIGEFRSVPDDLGTLTADWWSGLRTWGMGSEGSASFALPLLDVLGIATLGSARLLRMVLIVGPVIIGVVGAWKLFGRTSSDYAPVAAATLYAASPLPYNALSGGSLKALALYALLPWILGNLIATSQRTSLGPLRSVRASTVALSGLVALLIAVAPFLGLMVLVLVVGFIAGSLLSGDMRGIVTLVLTTAIAVLVGSLLNLPYLLDISSWSQFAGSQTSRITDTPLTALLTLDLGPVGSSILGWAVFAPALFAVLSATGERFTWAMRIWGSMLLCWAIAWANVRGWSPVGLPVTEVLLVPVSLGFAALGGIAALVIDVDLAATKKMRRFLPAAAAVVGFVIAVVPLLGAAGSGRWEVARVDLSTTYESLESDPGDGSYRVLWVGDAHVLGAASIPTANGLAWTTSLDGVPDIRALWGGRDEGATTALSEAVAAGLDGRTSRLGRSLAPFGIRYIVVMDQQAPVPEASRREVVSDVRAAPLNGQLDLVSDGVVNPAVRVYRNTVWAPVHAALAPASLEALQFTNADPAVTTRSGHATFTGQTRVERNVYASWEPSPRWVLEVDGRVAARIDTGAVGMGFQTADAVNTEAQLTYQTADSHRIIVILQALAWVVLFAGRRWLVGERRRADRAENARLERIG